MTILRLAGALVVLAVLGSARVVFAQVVLQQFEGISNADNKAFGISAFPPDNNLAAGPAHIFQITNVVGRITDKTGGVIQTFAVEGSFAVDAGFDSSDPRVIYDAVSGRWFATHFQFSFAQQQS